MVKAIVFLFYKLNKKVYLSIQTPAYWKKRNKSLFLNPNKR